MPYLIDSSAFIQAKNMFYRFSFCPGFWDWVAAEHRKGQLFSTDRVRIELLDKADELADWAKNAVEGFFLTTTVPIVARQAMVAAWVQANGQYKQSAKADFLAKADPFLVAHASETGFVLITHEISAPDAQKRVPLPDVCMQFGVTTINLFDVLDSTECLLRLQTP
jgi:hypothetical protein